MSVDVCSKNTLPPYFFIEQGTESGWDVNLKASSDFLPPAMLHLSKVHDLPKQCRTCLEPLLKHMSLGEIVPI